MRELPAVRAAFDEVDEHLEKQRSVAIANGDATRVDKIDAYKQINDQAYFVLCFGQIEQALNRACSKAIRDGQNAPRWEDRRTWSLYNPSDPRLSGLRLEDRAALVLDRDDPKRHFSKLMTHYEARNIIAHGKLLATAIDIDAMVDDLYVIQGAFR